MTAELLASVVGVLLSLLFSYVPGFRQWFEQFNPDQKRLAMLVMLLAVALSVFGLSCSGLYSWVTCDQAGALGLVSAFVAALIANQAAFLVSPKVQSE